VSHLTIQWHRFGDQRIDVVDDFTRLTLDTIALCTFSHRFNSFYSESAPPFVQAMSRSLKAAGLKTRRLPGTSWLYRATDKEFEEDVALQHSIADEVGSTRDRKKIMLTPIVGERAEGKR
jgi:cytochrome P450/NADPH-cytochrome P450 reductase